MVKREQADSGLRAGFIREEDVMKQIVQQSAPAPSEEKRPAPEPTAAPTSAADTPDKPADKGQQITMDKGVSGKVITGTMMVVKRKATKTEAEKEEERAPSPAADTLPEKTAPLPAETPKLSQAEKVPVQKTVKKETEAVEPKETVSAEKKAEVLPEIKVLQPEEAAPKKTEEKAAEAPARVEPAPVKTAEEEQKTPPAQAAAQAKTAPAVAEARKEVPRPQLEEKKAQPLSRTQEHVLPPSPPKAEPRRDEAAKAPVKARQPVSDQAAATEGNRPAAVPRNEVKVDQGVVLSAAERLAQRGKTIIRPQKGNYVGRDKDTPAFREPRSYSSDRGFGSGQGSRPQGQRPRQGGSRPAFGSQGGRPGFGSQGGGFAKDKDAEETQRRTRSPKPQKQGTRFSPAPDLGEAKKTESRRAFAAQHKGRQEGRNTSRQGRPEIAFDEETLRRDHRRKSRRQEQQTQAPAPQRTQLMQVKLPESMSVKELAEMLKKTSAEVITKLMAYGVMANLNQEIDFDTAEVVANEFGIKAEKLVEVSEEEILFDDSLDKEEDLISRPPVVVVMGHVDHGKTSILDWIRSSKVAAGEAGGITQHIGAYMVNVNGRKITFLDTPGHEAFTAMRARGAQVTDIAILVVAADDGVMPQTIEAIHHAKAAGTEVIVAINKIDKAGVNLDRVKQELASNGLLAPEWGGDVTMVPVSAKTGQNMDELLEMVLLTADVMDLKANPDRQAKGTVIEARLDKARGPVATILVQRGTLNLGDTVVVGAHIGNIRAMSDDRGRAIKSAGPSVPVEILGLPDVPEDGDIFYVVENDRVARNLVERRQEEERERQLKRTTRVSLDNLFEKMNEGETKELNIIIKADVQGSVEAITQSMEKLSNDEVKIRTIHGAVGAVTESDVRLADVSEAIIIGFNVRPAANVSDMAKEMNVDIRLYRVIYEALEDMENAMKGLLAPTFEEEVLGHADVREIYKASGIGTIAGCYVTDGKLTRSASLRLIRDGIIIHEGKLASLKRFKDDVREVQQNYECGLNIERFNDVKVGDVVEVFRMKEVERK